MALTKSVLFTSRSAPTLAEVRAASVGYFGPDTKIEVDRIDASSLELVFVMPGRASGIFDAQDGIKRESHCVYSPIRCVAVEAHVGSGGVSVGAVNIITRRCDDLTQVVANGLFEFFACQWKGRRDGGKAKRASKKKPAA